MEQWEQLVKQQGLVALAAEPDRAAPSSGSGNASGRGGAAAHQHQPLPPLPAGSSLAEVQQRLSSLQLCLCLGAEGQGVSPAVLQRCTPVSIPQHGEMESLNAAAAGAILMFALSAGAAPLLSQLAGLQGGSRK